MESAVPFWHTRRALVTGCTGFLGTWVVRELLAHGADVVGLVRDKVPDSDLIRDKLYDRIAVVRGRIEDGPRLRQTLAIHDIDTVFHLAAPVGSAHATPTDWLDTLLAAVTDVAPEAVVVVPFPRAAQSLAQQAVATASRPFGAALLPTIFGSGDRRSDRLVPRTARALITGERCTLPTPEELAEPHLFAADAAHALVDFAEAVAVDPHRADQPADLTPEQAVTGADVFAALTGRASQHRAIFSLALSTAQTLAWFRARHVGPARQSAAA